MLLVEAYIDKSPIQGIGVFAKRFIAKGAVIWTLDQRFDRLIEIELYESMTGPVKDYLDRYAYPRRSDPRYIVFEADDARYMNHADDPNCDFGARRRRLCAQGHRAGRRNDLQLQCVFRGRVRVPRGSVAQSVLALTCPASRPEKVARRAG